MNLKQNAAAIGLGLVFFVLGMEITSLFAYLSRYLLFGRPNGVLDWFYAGLPLALVVAWLPPFVQAALSGVFSVLGARRCITNASPVAVALSVATAVISIYAYTYIASGDSIGVLQRGMLVSAAIGGLLGLLVAIAFIKLNKRPT